MQEFWRTYKIILTIIYSYLNFKYSYWKSLIAHQHMIQLSRFSNINAHGSHIFRLCKKDCEQSSEFLLDPWHSIFYSIEQGSQTHNWIGCQEYSATAPSRQISVAPTQREDAQILQYEVSPGWTNLLSDVLDVFLVHPSSSCEAVAGRSQARQSPPRPPKLHRHQRNKKLNNHINFARLRQIGVESRRTW